MSEPKAGDPWWVEDGHMGVRLAKKDSEGWVVEGVWSPDEDVTPIRRIPTAEELAELSHQRTCHREQRQLAAERGPRL